MYILMAKLPRIEVKDLFNKLGRKEQDGFRAAFKGAWL